MRIGRYHALFAASFIALLGVLALTVPLPLGPRAPSDPLPALAQEPRCFDLRYPTSPDRYMPRRIRLESGFSPNVAPARVWYAASTDARLWNDIAWRPFGADSIDIASYDSPRIRLPAAGEQLTGQVIPTGTGTLFQALWMTREPVEARRVSCER